jgi:acetylornithine deacetylase/succinyl-diaminopimelate desuccinylase-like protein
MKDFSQPQMDRMLDWICAIQQIPAPTFKEAQRSAYLQSQFHQLGLASVMRDPSGNVLACWPGGKSRPLVISAHLDTVHPQMEPLPIERTSSRITGPGVADNSTSLAALLTLAEKLSSDQIHYPGDIWLAADVGEEGLGNLSGMNALVDRFQAHPLAYLVLEGLGLGQICHRSLGVIRYRVSAETAGGHSWVDYGVPSAIHELVQVMSRLVELDIPRNPRASLNIGIIQGGVSINTIAAAASFDLDLRAEDQSVLSQLDDWVLQAVKSQEKSGVILKINAIGSRPAGEIPASHPLVQLGLKVLQQVNVPATLEIGSTDANVPLSRGYPAICIGLTRGQHPHTHRETIEIEPLTRGMAQLLGLVANVWDLNS